MRNDSYAMLKFQKYHINFIQIQMKRIVSQKLKDLVIRFFYFSQRELTSHFNNPVVRYLLRIFYKNYLKRYLPMLNTDVQIALTYRCQCRCIHCGSALYKQKQGKELTSSEVMRLVDEVRRLGAGSVYFFGGEPLLVPQLTDYIRYAKRKGLTVILDANGFMLNENMVKKLKEAGIDCIGISIDSPFEIVHDKLRGISGIFNRAIAGIKYCKKYNVGCYMSTYTTKEKLKNGELEKTINLAKTLGVKIRILTPTLCGEWLNRNDLVLSPKEIALLRSFLEKNKVYWEREDLDNKETPFVCPAFEKGYFHISAYGDVQPCCFLPVSFGNIRKEPLISIVRRMWSSDMFVNYEVHNCPSNEKSFRQRYGIDSVGPYPKRFSTKDLKNEHEADISERNP